MCVYWLKSLRAVRTLPRSPPLLSLVPSLIKPLGRWYGTRRVHLSCQGAHREDLGS